MVALHSARPFDAFISRLKISGIAPWSPASVYFTSSVTLPPQDFWNRAVVAQQDEGNSLHSVVRLKISGIAPWSPGERRIRPHLSAPPQDFWNRAVVAKACASLLP